MIPESNFSFTQMFSRKTFHDSFEAGAAPIDVVMPLLHSNELFRNNLISIYSQIPVARLIVGDAGVIDESLSVLSEFPRVEVQDHREIRTLGRSLALLIDSVRTDSFAYVHSDVELPEGWYNPMRDELQNHGWVGSRMEVVVLQHFSNNLSGKRPLAGAQLGKKEAFSGIASRIEDDYVYRQEDFVLAKVAEDNGFTLGEAGTFHWHQQMPRRTIGTANNVEIVEIRTKESESEVLRIHETQSFGFIKYCAPDSPAVVEQFKGSAKAYLAFRPDGLKRLTAFANEHNPAWVPVVLALSLKGGVKGRVRAFMLSAVSRIFG